MKDGVEQGDKVPSGLPPLSSDTATSQSAEDFISCKKMVSPTTVGGYLHKRYLGASKSGPSCNNG